jgi:hypothetical protein
MSQIPYDNLYEAPPTGFRPPWDRLAAMAFGQQSGPPATGRQVQELLALLINAGHTDFRDARGPMGFNQRQSAGKFTRDEAAAFIEQLQQAEQDVAAPVTSRPSRRLSSEKQAPPKMPAEEQDRRKMSSEEQALRKMPAQQLAAELQRRGWMVIEPWS